VLERRIALAALLAHAAALAAAAPRAPAASAPPAPGHIIVIENMQYTPAELHVRRGERVTWVNKDLVPHTATARDKTFDSQALAAGASWSTVAARAGRIAYACTFHPTMAAVLVVE
jgi:plastocyanin